MTKRMLVDATHPEETRVVVVSGNRLEELDFEIASRKQLKGNIYLAKVTRVEPSLQAAFVEYGGNRHGFLAFAEIHPDYYRIPMADREALIEEEERLQAAEERRQEEMVDRRSRRDRATPAAAEGYAPESIREHISPMPEPLDLDADAETGGDADAETGGDVIPETEHTLESQVRFDSNSDAVPVAEDSVGTTELPPDEPPAGTASGGSGPASDSVGPANDSAAAAIESAEPDLPEERDAEDGDEPGTDENGTETNGGEPEGGEPDPRIVADRNGGNGDETYDTVGGDDVEEVQHRRPRPLRSYKIQEVIKRRQIMLVQVTKEERGNKGAALTTYLSLPGRFCVLMPNTGRGGGISRKITNPADRKRLKDILSDLDIPRGMAVILRTAGLERSKPEIKRDLEYLLRLWDDIREQTLQSTAPTLIYEEANLIKRAIRDVYSNEIDEIWVEGAQGFATAKDFMRMLMPGQTGRVQLYTDDTIPLFHRYQVEQQIDAIHSPVVQLRSGGYIVINPTEALVAIDVNSGKSTRERNIEETAFKTNLEAAEEVARQLRLRDLAGLIVIDFIDMEDPRNNATVERRLKEAMKNDRARIQLGRISPFGLLELSRQRLRPSLLETNFVRCPHCAGTGVVRSVESAALHVLRAIEEEGIRKRSSEINVAVPTQIALYILNQKRGELTHIEERYGFRVMVVADDTLIAPDLRIDRVKAKVPGEEGAALVSAERVLAETDRALAAEDTADEDTEAESEEAEGTESEARGEAAADNGEAADRRRRRRRRRRRPDQRDGVETRTGTAAEEAGEPADEAEGTDSESDAEADGDSGEDSEAEDGTDAAGFDPNESEADRKKRRRGKRGGRRRSRPRDGETEGESTGEAVAGDAEPAQPVREPVVRAVLPPPGEVKPLEPIDFDWILGDVPADAEPAEAAAPPTIQGDTPPTGPDVGPDVAPEIAESGAPEAAPVVDAREGVDTPAPEAPIPEAPIPEAPVAETVTEAAAEAPAVEMPAAKPRKRSTTSRSRKTKAAVEPVDAAPEAAPPVDAPAAEPVPAVATPEVGTPEVAGAEASAPKAKKRSTTSRSRKKKAAAEPVDAAPESLPDAALVETVTTLAGDPPGPADVGSAPAGDWPTVAGPDAEPSPEELAFAKHLIEVGGETGDTPATPPPTKPEAPVAPAPAADTAPADTTGEPSAKPRRGWWNRLIS